MGSPANIPDRIGSRPAYPEIRPNPENTRILAFACVWIPFGGARTEDVFVEFGLTPDRYRARLTQALQNPEAEHLSKSQRVALIRQLGTEPPTQREAPIRGNR